MNNISQRLSRRLLLLPLLLLLTACGQKGPLRLPDDSENRKLDTSDSYFTDNNPTLDTLRQTNKSG